ncbi:hypothetical protein [Pseudomonas sp. F(2018)]|uniref:hypothetical protein n=1 Tax=Pseudomonas sp. F(2018) TaxID=2502240 RepID=UPI0010F8BE16|nr:hypothetical protein [Pseudomonas sp. F(2018)]
MDIEAAKEIQNSTQRCIRELNSMLLQAKSNLSPDEFENLKLMSAQIMGHLVELEHVCIYAEYPALKPY